MARSTSPDGQQLRAAFEAAFAAAALPAVHEDAVYTPGSVPTLFDLIAGMAQEAYRGVSSLRLVPRDSESAWKKLCADIPPILKSLGEWLNDDLDRSKEEQKPSPQIDPADINWSGSG